MQFDYKKLKNLNDLRSSLRDLDSYITDLIGALSIIPCKCPKDPSLSKALRGIDMVMGTS